MNAGLKSNNLSVLNLLWIMIDVSCQKIVMLAYC